MWLAQSHPVRKQHSWNLNSVRNLKGFAAPEGKPSLFYPRSKSYHLGEWNYSLPVASLQVPVPKAKPHSFPTNSCLFPETKSKKHTLFLCQGEQKDIYSHQNWVWVPTVPLNGSVILIRSHPLSEPQFRYLWNRDDNSLPTALLWGAEEISPACTISTSIPLSVAVGMASTLGKQPKPV